MSDWKSSISSFVSQSVKDDDDDKKIISEDLSLSIVVKTLKTSKTFPDLLRDLGTYLTSTSAPIRVRACALIAHVLEQGVPVDDETANVVTSFLLSRLSDFPSIEPALRGCVVLLKLNKKRGLDFVKTLYDSVHVAGLPQGLRELAYEGISISMSSFEFDEDFVLMLTSLIEGEKDPRSLRTCFDLLHRAASSSNVKSSKVVEELFESSACYFPISFTPPPNDKFGVTREELVIGLRQIFASRGDMGKQHVLPMLLKKLGDVTIPISARVDVLDTLTCCVDTGYDANVLSNYLKSLATTLHQEIVNADEDAVECAALNAICVIARVVSESSSDILWLYVSTHSLDSLDTHTHTHTDTHTHSHFVEPLISGCVKELINSKTRTMLGDRALRVLQHLSRASRKVYDAVISKSISALLVSNNEDVVDTIVQLIKCDAVAEITLVSKKNQLIHPLKQHANQLLDLFLTNHNFEGLRHLLIQPPKLLVSKENLIRTIKTLCDISNVTTLVDISSRHYEFIHEEIRTLAVKILQDKNDFDALISLSSIHVDVFDRVVPVLVKSHLDNLSVLKSLARLVGNTNTKVEIVDRFVKWNNKDHVEPVALSLLSMYQDKSNTMELLRVSRIVIQRVVSRCSDSSVLMKRACDSIMKGSNSLATTVIGSASRNVSIDYDMYKRLMFDTTNSSSDVSICLASRLNKEKDETVLDKVSNVFLNRYLLFIHTHTHTHTRQVLKDVRDESKLVWIAKALILRGHRYASITISRVLKNVKGHVKTKRVEILAGIPPFSMTRLSGARVKVTWRQRLFCTLFFFFINLERDLSLSPSLSFTHTHTHTHYRYALGRTIA